MKICRFALALLLAPCAALAGEPNEKADYLPKKLNVTSILFRGHHSTLAWDGKVLVYDKTVDRKALPQRQIKPTEAAWKKFWKEMDAIEVWKWHKEYIDKTLADGHSWSLTLERGDKKVQTEGRNMFPTQFKRYEKAVQELTGEHPGTIRRPE